MTNAVPPTGKYALNLIQSDDAASGWRDGCVEFANRYPRYLTVLKGGKLSSTPNFFHILAAALKCGFETVTNDNWQLVLAAVEKRAHPLYQDENVIE